MKVLQLTGICHRNCLYCMDEYKNIKHSNIKQIIKMIPKIKDKHILVTGGEPLLIKEINEIIAELAKYDKVITLHTEGTLIKRLTKESLTKIKCISLPLDSTLNSENKNLKRAENQYEICVEAINYVKDYCDIRISSVLTSYNQKGIIHLAHVLKKLDVEWRVYELNPTGNACDNLSKLELDKAKQSEIFDVLKVIKADTKIMNISDDYGDYFYITPKLELMHYINNKYKHVKTY